MAWLPLPGDNGTGLLQGMETGSNLLNRLMQQRIAQQQQGLAQQQDMRAQEMQPARLDLLKAQIQEAQANANKKMQLMDIIKRISNGEDILNTPNNTSPSKINPSLSNSDKESINNLKPGESYQVKGNEQNQNNNEPIRNNDDPMMRYKKASILHGLTGNTFGKIEIKDVDGTQYAITPFDSPIPLVKGPNTFQKSLGKEYAKTVGDWNTTLTNVSTNVNPIFQNLNKILSNPAIKEIKANPELFGKDMAWFKRFGTEDQQSIASSLSLNLANLRQQMLQGFKGSARQWENDIVDKAKIDEKDTLTSTLSKYSELKKLKKLMSDRIQVANDLVVNKGISPIEALKQSEKVIDYDTVQKEIQKEMADITKKAQINSNKKTYTKSEIQKYIDEAISAGVPKSAIDAKMKELEIK